MTSVETEKLKDLITEHQRFQRTIENEQAVFKNVDNILNSVRTNYTQSYVLSAVNTTSSYVRNAKNTSAKLIDHINKKRTGLQSVLEIYLDAERNASNAAKENDTAKKTNETASEIVDGIAESFGPVGATVVFVGKFLEFITGAKTPKKSVEFVKSIFDLADKFDEKYDALKALTKANFNIGKVAPKWADKLLGLNRFWKVSKYGNASVHSNTLTQFSRNSAKIVKGELKELVKPKSIGQAVVKWGGLALDAVLKGFENFERFRGEDWARIITQTALEVAVDVAIGLAIKAAVGAVAVAIFGAAAAPFVLVAAGVALITIGLDALSKYLTGKDLDTLIADGIISAAKWIRDKISGAANWVGDKIGDITSGIKDFWNWITGGDGNKGKVDAIWAQANDRIRQAIIDTQYVVDSIINGMPVVGKCALLSPAPALAGAGFTMSNSHYAALSRVSENYGSLRNQSGFLGFIGSVAVSNQQALTSYIMDELANYVRSMLLRIHNAILGIMRKIVGVFKQPWFEDLVKYEWGLANFLDAIYLTKRTALDGMTYNPGKEIFEIIRNIVKMIIESIRVNTAKIEAKKAELKNSSVTDLYKMLPNCKDSFERTAILQLLREKISYEEAMKMVFNANGVYGGDQGAPLSRFAYGDDPNFIKFMRELLPGKNDGQIEDYLSTFNNVGCGYVAMANTVFVQYANRPDEFEKIFGFPMYQIDGSGNISYNFDYLVVDLYNSSGKIGEGTTFEDREKMLEDYLHSKGVKVSVTSDQLDVTGVAEALKNGQVILRQRPVILHRANGSKQISNGGHAIVVTGIDTNGNLIVSSWGELYTINPADYSTEGIKKYFSNYAGSIYLDYEVVTFE
ncbi:MAG: C39 family peptidase [Clostridiales bacterium]|jgi:hypothetical protein|nr:C39 family peptidase [Clostridiales bacterium]